MQEINKQKAEGDEEVEAEKINAIYDKALLLKIWELIAYLTWPAGCRVWLMVQAGLEVN